MIIVPPVSYLIGHGAVGEMPADARPSSGADEETLWAKVPH